MKVSPKSKHSLPHNLVKKYIYIWINEKRALWQSTQYIGRKQNNTQTNKSWAITTLAHRPTIIETLRKLPRF